MRRILLLVLVASLLAGCIGPADDGTNDTGPDVDVPPIEPDEPAVPDEPEEEEDEKEVAKIVTEDHHCLKVMPAEETSSKSITQAENLMKCFEGMGDYVDCAYFLTKEGRRQEQAFNVIGSWSIQMYGKAHQCIKDGEAEGVVFPEGAGNTIYGYYVFYNTGDISWTTEAEMDQLIQDLNATRYGT